MNVIYKVFISANGCQNTKQYKDGKEVFYINDDLVQILKG